MDSTAPTTLASPPQQLPAPPALPYEASLSTIQQPGHSFGAPLSRVFTRTSTFSQSSLTKTTSSSSTKVEPALYSDATLSLTESSLTIDNFLLCKRVSLPLHKIKGVESLASNRQRHAGVKSKRVAWAKKPSRSAEGNKLVLSVDGWLFKVGIYVQNEALFWDAWEVARGGKSPQTEA